MKSQTTLTAGSGASCQKPNTLRQFTQVHIDEDLSNLKGTFENALFFNCKFHSLNGLTLKNCVLDHSHFTASDPKDLLGFTLTLDCFSFEDVELSETVFDTLLLLLCKSKGNTEKRKKIIEQVVGHERSIEILRQLKALE
jgi:hypothetical protein